MKVNADDEDGCSLSIGVRNNGEEAPKNLRPGPKFGQTYTHSPVFRYTQIKINIV